MEGDNNGGGNGQRNQQGESGGTKWKTEEISSAIQHPEGSDHITTQPTWTTRTHDLQRASDNLVVLAFLNHAT